eukprot:gene7391-8627_t
MADVPIVAAAAAISTGALAGAISAGLAVIVAAAVATSVIVYKRHKRSTKVDVQVEMESSQPAAQAETTEGKPRSRTLIDLFSFKPKNPAHKSITSRGVPLNT